MSPLANDFMQALHSASITFERNTDGQLRIPARSSEVGDLFVSFADDEITFFIGNITHQHFTPGTRGNPERQTKSPNVFARQFNSCGKC